MDVHSIREARLRERLRSLPPRLDAVIDRAKAQQAADERFEQEERAAARRKSKLRGAGLGAKVVAAFAGADSAAAVPTGGGGGGYSDGGGGRGHAKRRDGVRGGRGDREKAQVVGNTRTISFHASTALFKGGRAAYSGSVHNYPHAADPNHLNLMMGAELRSASLNAELRAAREAKHDDDLRAMARAEAECEASLELQQDGQKLRLGRIATPDQWSISGELRRRGQVATWKWTPGFYVLCDGMLMEFAGSALSSPIVNAWPVLGAIPRKGSASSQSYPHVLELKLSAHHVPPGAEVLAKVEFATVSKEERHRWMAALERASLQVSKDFRDPDEGGMHLEGHAAAAAAAAVAAHMRRAEQSGGGSSGRSGGGSSRSGGGSSRSSRLGSWRLSQLASRVVRRKTPKSRTGRAPKPSGRPSHEGGTSAWATHAMGMAGTSNDGPGARGGHHKKAAGSQAYLSARRAAPRMARSPVKRG